MADKLIPLDEALELSFDAIKEYYGEAELQNVYGSTSCVPVQTPYNRTGPNGERLIGIALVKEKYDAFVARDEARVSAGLPKFYEDKIFHDGTNYWWIGQYYLKRLSLANGGGTAETATSSGSNVGVVTTLNYNTKLKNGEISSVFNKDNAEDHHEPEYTTIMCRDGDGRAVVESGPNDYHVANNKKVKEIVKEKSFSDQRTLTLDYGKDGTTKLVPGWYRIAETKAASTGLTEGTQANIFHIDASMQGVGATADAMFALTCPEWNAPPSASVIHFDKRADHNIIPKCRIIYTLEKMTDKSTGKAKAAKRYLDIYVNPSNNTKYKIQLEIQQIFSGARDWSFISDFSQTWIFSDSDADRNYNASSKVLGLSPSDWANIQNQYSVNVDSITALEIDFEKDPTKDYIDTQVSNINTQISNLTKKVPTYNPNSYAYLTRKSFIYNSEGQKELSFTITSTKAQSDILLIQVETSNDGDGRPFWFETKCFLITPVNGDGAKIIYSNGIEVTTENNTTFKVATNFYVHPDGSTVNIHVYSNKAWSIS